MAITPLFSDVHWYPSIPKKNLGLYLIHKSHIEEIKIYLEFFLNLVPPNQLWPDTTTDTDQISL